MKFFTAIFAVFLAGIVLVSVVPIEAQVGLCRDNNDCSGGWTCVSNSCVPPSQPKSSGSDCPPGTPVGTTCIGNPLKAKTFAELIDGIINFIFAIAIAITPIMVIIGGFMFVTGGGDPVKITRGKQLLLWTVIGLTVILLAKSLVAVLRSTLGI